MIIGRIPSALAGFRAASAREAQSAHNVANINTPGFQAVRVAPQAVRAADGVSRPAVTGSSQFLALDGSNEVPASNTDLVAETLERIVSAQSFKASIAAFRAGDEMTQSLLRIRA